MWHSYKLVIVYYNKEGIAVTKHGRLNKHKSRENGDI
jgi:hypothetical protein